MYRWMFVVLTLLFLLSGGCAALTGGDSDETVEALRYRVLVYDSFIDFTHGNGRWMDELYFPEQGVICGVDWESEVEQDEKGTVLGFKLIPSLWAMPGSMEEHRNANPPDHPEGLKPPVPVKVAAKLAKEIFRLAEVTRSQHLSARRLGPLAVKQNIIGDHDSVTEYTN